MLPEPVEYAAYFHETFREHPEAIKKRMEWKKLKKKSKNRPKEKNTRIDMFTEDYHLPPEIELPSNASAFATFASIRLAVFDRWMKHANQEYLQSSCCSAPFQDSEIESDTEDNTQSSTFVPIKLSKIVGLGLRSVFEIIKESRSTHPNLCTKALIALHDVLQGQSPEGLKYEPNDVVDPLFELLLDLATLHVPESSFPNNATHLTAIACACLLSLVVVRGDTGKLLSATSALLMCPRSLSNQNIQMPSVLSSLQRSVHGVLLGKVQRPDWITHGVPQSSRIDSFHLIFNESIENMVPKSLAMDGLYVYLYTSKGLFKIGSGYGGTLKGNIYVWKPEFYPNDNGSLVYCSGKLYLKLTGRRGVEFLIVEQKDLLISGSIPLHSRDSISSVVFSDGEHLGTISPTKDDGFVIRMLNQNTIPASVISELPLKLARKCVDVLGSSSFEDEGLSHTVNTGNDEEIASICAGKEFGLIRTTSGKVLYCGKSSALGIKQSGIKSCKWSELILSKSPKITHVSVGHDGLHAILLTEDGSAYFTGTARRGEDGDQSKVRRQPKSIKPKKIIKVDGQFIVSSACNNGTTALITRDGELLMFGKDTTHSDPTTGFVYTLKGEFIAQVALGKAHAVALTSKGQVYTFGINNKYQCGREFTQNNVKESSSSNIVAMDTCGTLEDHEIYEELLEDGVKESGNDGNNLEPNQLNMCLPGMHSWHDERCMICTICRECTGYSISCLSSISERNPGQECGCGEGDSGCSICGCCRICAREVVDNSELADLAGMMRLDVIFRDKILIPPRQRSKLQEQIQSRLEERRKGRKSLPGPSTKQSSNQKVKTTRAPSSSSPNTSTTNTANNRSNNLVRSNNLKELNSDVERDATRIACLPPAKIVLPSESPVIQIACGQHHSLLLCQNGQVYGFGSNLYGQLGCGDILAKNSMQLVKLPCSAIHVAAGNNHSVVLTSKGEVYTFGSHQKGQLGRFPPNSPGSEQPGQSSMSSASSSSSKFNNPRTPWYSIPSPVPNIGPRHGRRATWVGASGDQTFIKIDESLINSVSISKSTITANRNSLVLIPNYEESCKSFSCLVINKRDGSCNSFKGKDQMSFCGKSICLDPLYNVIWSYDPTNHRFECFNITLSELNNTHTDRNYKQLISITTPELSLPLATNCHVTRFQASLNLLCCLDTLSIAHDLQMSAVKEESDERHLHVTGKQYSKEDYQVVNRFESHGGGWGYSGHSIEAIRFMADTDVLLGGFGLFGGRGEYTAKIKLFDIGPEGGEQEGDGELLSETEEIPYECGPRQKHSILFDEPIQLNSNRWYVAWCRISGPSSDCGSSGQTMVTSEDQVLFYFKSSKKSNNGTDVNAGQIPQILYKVITPENVTGNRNTHAELVEPVHILSKDFSRTVTKECFQSLLSLLQWAWNTFKWAVVEGQNIKNVYTKLELSRLVYICKACLRLIKTYINEIYPSQIYKKILLENVNLAECIGEVRALLKQILSDSNSSLDSSKKSCKRAELIEMSNEILEESHNTFVACFHAFYPTAFLKWSCLCDLLSEIEKENTILSNLNSQRLLSAVLCALCAPYVRLRTTFPLLSCFNESIHKGLSPSDNTGLPMMSGSDSHHYPILVEQMSYRSQMESSCTGLSWNWKEVLERLLNLVSDPIRKNLEQNIHSPLPKLTRHCCHLLGRVVAELVHQCNATDEELQSGCGRILHITPSRFTRTNQSRTWNTGNGSPDAVCFQVDRPGISIAGVGVYGGIGHYEYEVELLEDSSTVGVSDSHAHTQRWNSLEVTRGSFGPEDFAPDIIEIKFDRAVPVKENFKYAIRLRNHGGRTNNGDGGLNSVKGSDGTNFIFSTCALSFNGTTLTRGQIPVILYYSNPLEFDGKTSTTKLEQQARTAALSMANSIIKKSCGLMAFAREKAEEVSSAEILSESSMVTTLLPFVIAHISPLATSDPRSAVYILGLIYELLPHVAALNLIGIHGSSSSGAATAKTPSSNESGSFDYRLTTTSHHYIWVQSEHPYKPSAVSNYRVKFKESVKWMSIEFDPACSTVQPEDTLQLYVPALESSENEYFDEASNFGDSPPFPYWPVLHKFSGCLQWPSNAIILPGNEVIFSLETASDYLKDEKASAYGFKCLVIGYEWPLPGMNSPLYGLKHLESELAFLGGMCATSLMKKELQLATFDDEAEIDVDLAEIIAGETFQVHSQLLSKGLALSNPPTVTQALEGMLPYSVHSNERLFLKDFVNCTSNSSGGRLAQWLQPGSRVDPSKCQVIYSRDELKCGWPTVITLITRDQYSDLVHVPNMKVEMKAIPIDKKELGGATETENVEISNRKIRRVSCGVVDTITPSPNLQFPYEPTVKDKMYFHSITVMKPYQNYSFEELRFMSPPVKRTSETMLVRPNLDGTYSATWTPSSVGCYSLIINIDGYEMEEIFRVEVKEPPQGILPPTQHQTPKKSVQGQPNKLRKFVAKNSAGLRIRAHPSLQSEQIGIVHVNGTIAFIDEIHNDDGVWLRLSMDTIKNYCNNGIIEAWCLQYNQHLGKTLLLPVEEPKTSLDQAICNTIRKKLPEIHDRKKLPINACKEYIVIKCGASGHNVRSKPNLNAPRVGMLVLGNRIGVAEYIVNSDGCWVLLDEVTREKYCFNTEEEAWSLAMSQNDTLYLESINDEKTSENGGRSGFDFTQTDAGKFLFLPSVKKQENAENFSTTNPFIFGGESSKLKSEVGKISAIPKWFKSEEPRSEICDEAFERVQTGNGNGTPPETPKRSRSPAPKIPFRNMQKVEAENPVKLELDGKKLTQTGTQTSPENLLNSSNNVGHFSIGATVVKDEKISPKMCRKTQASTKIRKRTISPAVAATLQNAPSAGTSSKLEQAKLAMSPSLAESLRAVFAAFLWHEGIVHDAMACASFLKFHPTLPKQGALVVTRNHPETPPVNKRQKELSKEEKARQRHSVEVTTNAGSYLQIQPATLESLTKSAANANANRNKLKKITPNSNSINEEEVSNTDKSNYPFQTVSVLPPALKSLVYLWEELSSSCFQAITQQMVAQSPTKSRKNERRLSNNSKNDFRDKSSTITVEKDVKKGRKKKTVARNYLEDIGIPTYVASNESETVCELCGETFPHPVTYHMHQSHPGCGQHAGGKGYNSGGNYCLGWAGNCGDGGVPGSSWYLLCEPCREKYVKAYRNGKQFTNRVRNLQRRIHVKTNISMMAPSLTPGLDPHIIMKNNAMFLLDLASSSDSTALERRRSSTSFMPALAEHNSSPPPDFYGPFSPVPPFQCLQSLGAGGHSNEPDIYEAILRRNVQDGFYTGQRPFSEVSDTDLDEFKSSRFHRSISMGTNGIPFTKTGSDGRIIMTRRRNNSNSETNVIDGCSSLLCNPSSALQQLIPKTNSTVVVPVAAAVFKDPNNSDDDEMQNIMALLQRPVMQFLMQQHDLESLKLSMKQALRKASCRVYAMQALNWLLKSVTQPLCLHDLLWWFVTSLTPSDYEIETEDDNKPARKVEEDLNVCEHPLSDIMIAGEAVHPLPTTFHALLQTIADLMVLLPMGSSLQQIAVRCWGIRFATSDHSFLHRSQVFSNISKILSRSEELEDCAISMHESAASNNFTSIEALKDLTNHVEIKCSSRQAMVGSLTDCSTETFWESGDEDRNKTKNLLIVVPQGYSPSLICVHIDNCRDLGNKVSNATFYSGPSSDELVKLRSVEVDTRLGGWINCPIPTENDNVVKIELKGPDNSVRVRQVRILGNLDSGSRSELQIGKQFNSCTIQQRNCESETLRVFRLITAQVFGKLIQGNRNLDANTTNNGSNSEGMEPIEDSNDLREHMVGILFSRSKLTHLQKQVIVHIVQAIRKEAVRIRDEWELSIFNQTVTSTTTTSYADVKNSDTYCFEMLSMVLALSGSSVGRAYLSHQNELLGDLLSLLHTASARVQRQVTSLLRRMLPEISPEIFAKVVGVSTLPPKDFNDVILTSNKTSNLGNFDIHKQGILDVFLSVIAKSLTVQVKFKGKTGGCAVKEINTVTLATTVQPKDYLGTRWWLRGAVNRKLSEVIVSLIKDMVSGKLSESWEKIAKGAIAENILNLTHLSEEQRVPNLCLRTPTVWLALASLCVLDKDHVERLSSGQWSNSEGQTPRPTCSNHDDNETNAVIQCNICGNLCADCDRFLHLHRKTRFHQRQVCKEEEEAIKVELHEGCGRTKLFWLLALADARTLKALIEYRDGGNRGCRGAGTSGICRFCGATGTSGLLAIGNVCADSECQEYSKSACAKLLNCGHMCGGVIDEEKCLPCLHGCTKNESNLRQDADDMCMICFTEALSCAPSIQLKCGHVFHLHCCRTVLAKKWAGPRITFSFSQCPICKENMEHVVLSELLEPIQKLSGDVKRKALMRLEYEGLHTVEAIVTPGARFYNDPASYAMDRYAYYVCFKCSKAYYGGEARCDVEFGGENYDPAELVCGACSDVARAQMCPKHGTDFLEYKCRYCCSVAVFFCFGTTHFCNPCHDDFQRVTNLAKNELPNCPAGPKAKQLDGDECPLHVKHPPTGEEFALGCGVCRNAHTF